MPAGRIAVCRWRRVRTGSTDQGQDNRNERRAFGNDLGDAFRQTEGADGLGVLSVQDNRQVGAELPQFFDGIEAVEAKHGYIENHQVGIYGENLRNGFVAVGRFGDGFNAGGVQLRADGLAHYGAVVSDENAAHDEALGHRVGATALGRFGYLLVNLARCSQFSEIASDGEHAAMIAS
jgi:hypothetical protein